MIYIKKFYNEDPKKFLASTLLSLCVLLIGLLNVTSNNNVDNYIDAHFGPIASLVFLIIFESFALLFTMLGLFIYPSENWYYFGLLVGFFINGLMIFALLKLFEKVTSE